MKISKVTDYAALMIVFPSINETCADPQRGKGGAPHPKNKKKQKKKLQLAKVFLKNTGTDPPREKKCKLFQWTPPPLTENFWICA